VDEALVQARDEGLTLTTSNASSGYRRVVRDNRHNNFVFFIASKVRKRLSRVVSRTEMPYGVGFRTAAEAALILARSEALAAMRELQKRGEATAQVKNAPCGKYAPFLALLDQRRRYLRAVRDARVAAGIESSAPPAGHNAHAPTEVLRAVACSDVEGDSDEDWHIVECIDDEDSDDEALATPQLWDDEGEGGTVPTGATPSRGPGEVSRHAAAAEQARAAAAAAAAAAVAAAAAAEASSDHKGDTCCIYGCNAQLLRCHGHKHSGDAIGRAESGHTLCMPCLDRWFSSQSSLREERGLAPLSRRTCPVCMCPLRATETHMRTNADQYALGLFKLPGTW